MAIESLGIKGIEAIHYYVHDLERSRRFLTQIFDFEELAESNNALEKRGHQRSLVFRAASCVIVCSEPKGEGGRAWRYLRKHPEGVGTLIFAVEDIKRTFELLDKRGGTPITGIETHRNNGGFFSTFSITTPFGDTTFRFVERRDYAALYPDLDYYAEPKGGKNALAFSHIDHVTSNFQTMSPALLWLEHVMGFKRFWEIEFHTDDVAGAQDRGSGLRSAVMWDEKSGAKFANNEPYRPFFKDSQINIFNEQHRGDGVQHVALAMRDILSGVKTLRERGAQFMPTPGSYYDALPERLKKIGVEKIDEAIEDLRRLEILVDGDAKKSYLLQIFLKEAAGMFNDPKAGPFFFEIIQRKGDQGFGGGNFRALFESIEREQKQKPGLGRA